MKSPLSRILIKFLKITGIALAALLAMMFLLPYLFGGSPPSPAADSGSASLKDLENTHREKQIGR